MRSDIFKKTLYNRLCRALNEDFLSLPLSSACFYRENNMAGGGLDKSTGEYMWFNDDGTIVREKDFESHYQKSVKAGMSFSRIEILESMYDRRKAREVFDGLYDIVPKKGNYGL